MPVEMKVCPHCRREIRLKLADGVGLRTRWDGDFYLIGLVLLVEKYHLSLVLYREVYRIVRARA